jgi:DNA repair exonuclease SbcCD nuclease subunit
MKLAHLADLHITERTNGSTLCLDDQVELLLTIGQSAADNDASVLLVAGDIFDHLSTVRERNAAIEVFRFWANKMPVVAIYGNHDRAGDLDFLRSVRAKNRIHISNKPELLQIYGLSIATLPWPSTAAIAQRCDDLSLDTIKGSAGSALRAILRWYGTQKIDVLLGHVELGSAVTDSGCELSGIAELALSVDDLLLAKAKYYALGHIHKRQWFAQASDAAETPSVIYSGAPRATSFGGDNSHGYVLADIDYGLDKTIFARVPSRRLVTIDGFFEGDELCFGCLDLDEGDAVRLKYEVPSSLSCAAYAQASECRDKLLDAGAHSVVIDQRVVVQSMVRSAEIVKAKGPREQVDAVWAAGERPPRATEIMAKLESLLTVSAD